MSIIKHYINGNYSVKIHDDGSKIREYDDFIIPNPIYPETIDVKITDYCNAACPHCFESSTVAGIHASVDDMRKLIKQLPLGIEIAFGGGNVLSYPNFEHLLYLARGRGVISNITVNSFHIAPTRIIEAFRKVANLEISKERQVDAEMDFYGPYNLKDWQEKKLLHGIGISYNKAYFDDFLANKDEKFGYPKDPYDLKNVVIHVIVGVDSLENVARLVKQGHKILILGYKNYGRGIKFNDEMQSEIKRWRYWVGTLLNKNKSIISFDNLAIDQLEIKKLLTEEDWNKFYMGNDGSFSMYIDATKMEFAKTSISPRHKIGDLTLEDMFYIVRGM